MGIANKHNGGIDFIINSAGVLFAGPLINTSEDKVEEMINTNLLGSIHIAKHSYTYLKQAKGMLVFFSSSSYLKGRSNIAAYSATKSAVSNLSQGLAEEWQNDGIRVNCIAPSRTDTPMRAKNFTQSDDLSDLLDPDWVASKVEELIKSDITGVVVRVY